MFILHTKNPSEEPTKALCTKNTQEPLHQVQFQEKLPNHLQLQSHFSSGVIPQRQLCPLIQVWKEDGKGTEDNRCPFSAASHNSPGLEGIGGRRVWRVEERGGSPSSTENNDVSVFWNSKSIIMSSSSRLPGLKTTWGYCFSRIHSFYYHVRTLDKLL